MTRQQQMTREQVMCKISDAKSRMEKNREICKNHVSDTALDAYIKASSDYEIWRKVLDSLPR
jgi:hypothetical protein